MRYRWIILAYCLCCFFTVEAGNGTTNIELCLYPFSIEYQLPDCYLLPGNQTLLSEDSYLSIEREIGELENRLEEIGTILTWVRKNFCVCSAGGASIGTSNVALLYHQKQLGGCHDWAILLSCLLRRYGYPVVMVDTAGIQWARDYENSHRRIFSGHVFLEVFTENHWILLDPTTGEYIPEYDYSNPIIPIKKKNESTGYYVLYKGIDPAGYGITDVRMLNERMIHFSEHVEEIPLSVPDYVLKRFSR